MIENWEQYKDLEFYPDRVCKCGCGGGIKVLPYHRLDGIPEYISGHNRRGKHWSEESKKRVRGRKSSPEAIEKMRASKKGKTFEEIYGDKSEGMKENLRLKLTGCHFQTKESKKKICETSIQHWKDPKFREKMKENHEYRPLSEEHKQSIGRKNCKNMKRLWQDSEYREKQLPVVLEAMRKGRKVRPNKPEKQIDELLQKLLLIEWRYSGDGAFWVTPSGTHLNPDFVNTKQKKIIEVFGDYWHGEERTGVPNDQHVQERVDCFTQLGYRTLIIWVKELKNIEVLEKKILEFNNEE